MLHLSFNMQTTSIRCKHSDVALRWWTSISGYTCPFQVLRFKNSGVTYSLLTSASIQGWSSRWAWKAWVLRRLRPVQKLLAQTMTALSLRSTWFQRKKESTSDNVNDPFSALDKLLLFTGIYTTSSWPENDRWLRTRACWTFFILILCRH